MDDKPASTWYMHGMTSARSETSESNRFLLNPDIDSDLKLPPSCSRDQSHLITQASVADRRASHGHFDLAVYKTFGKYWTGITTVMEDRINLSESVPPSDGVPHVSHVV